MRVVASILFAMSTVTAVAIAPEKGAALRAALLLLGGLGAAWALAWAGLDRRRRPRVLRAAAWGAAGLAALIGGWYLLGVVAPGVVPDAVNANVAAAGLAVLLPMGVALVIGVPSPSAAASSAARRAGPVNAELGLGAPGRVAAAVLVLVGAGALVATGSVGAWLGLLLGALYGGWWALRPTVGRDHRMVERGIDGALVVLAVAGVGAWWVMAGRGADLLASPGARPSLWHDALGLIGDYRYTGAGLRSTMMVLSTYVYLLHVGYISHVHNLYLALALEQGLPGLIAFLFLVGTALAALVRAQRRQVVAPAMQGAIAAALVALLAHGLVDAALYASRLMPLIFLPIGLAWAAGGRVHGRTVEARGRRLLVAMTPLAALALLFVLPHARAAWQANLGAVAQSQAELGIYAWPAWPYQDALRRNPMVDLDGAIARYQAALALDPANVTANRRLGQIALSRGDVPAAQGWLAAAYAAAPDERATRMLLGEVYALQGEVDQARALLAGVNGEQGQFEARRWWIGETATAEQQAWYDAALGQ